jgi:hypothetical protein
MNAPSPALCHEFEALFDVLLEFRKCGLDQLLLGGCDIPERVDLLHAIGLEMDANRTSVPIADHEYRNLDRRKRTYPELNIAAEVLHTLLLEQRTLHERRLDHALLAIQRAQQRVGELSRGPGHRERRGASAILGLDDLVTAILDTMHERVVLLAGLDGSGSGARLREKGDDGDARVAADDGDARVLRVSPRDAAHEPRGADDVKRGDAKELARVERPRLLQHLRDDRHGRVDRVRDDENVRVGRVLADCLGEIAHDRRVRVE